MFKKDIVYDETWHDIFGESTDKEGYELLINLLQIDFDKEIFDDEVVIDDIFDVFSKLDENNLYEEVIFLDKLIEKKQKYIHKEVFPYLKSYIIDYYLFNNDEENIKKQLEYFILEPVKTIEQLLIILDKLQFYGYNDLVFHLVKRIYNEIKKSKKIMNFTVYDLEKFIFYYMLNKIYVDIKKGKKIIWEDFRNEVSEYNYFVRSDKNNDMAFELLKKVFLNNDIYNEQQSISINLSNICYGFLKKMYDDKNISFYYSKIISDHIYDFLTSLCNKNNTKETLKEFFTFYGSELKKENSQSFYSSFSNDKGIIDIFVLTWGIPYFFEYILELGIISKNYYNEKIEEINNIKINTKSIFETDLWKYNFLNLLGDLKNSDTNYNIFFESIKKISPLSDIKETKNIGINKLGIMFDEEYEDLVFQNSEYEEEYEEVNNKDDKKNYSEQNMLLRKKREKEKKKKKLVKIQKRKNRKKK